MYEMKKTWILIAASLTAIVITLVIIKKPKKVVDYSSIRAKHDSICLVFEKNMNNKDMNTILLECNSIRRKCLEYKGLHDSIKNTCDTIAHYLVIQNVEIEMQNSRERAKQKRIAKIKILSELRKNYPNSLRTKFLDAGYDIKVSIEGKQYKVLRLKFILFNDVWVHNFKKDGYYAIWKELGFEKVIFDGQPGDYYKSKYL